MYGGKPLDQWRRERVDRILTAAAGAITVRAMIDLDMTVSDLCATARVGSAHIYQAFPSKRAVVAEVLRLGLVDLAPLFDDLHARVEAAHAAYAAGDYASMLDSLEGET